MPSRLTTIPNTKLLGTLNAYTKVEDCEWCVWIAHGTSLIFISTRPQISWGAFTPGLLHLVPKEMIWPASMSILLGWGCFVFTTHYCKAEKSAHPRRTFLAPLYHWLIRDDGALIVWQHRDNNKMSRGIPWHSEKVKCLRWTRFPDVGHQTEKQWRY